MRLFCVQSRGETMDPNWNTIIVALVSLVGTCIGSWGGARLMTYRIEQLEKKVNKHNNLIERVYKLEKEFAVHEEDFKNLVDKVCKGA